MTKRKHCTYDRRGFCKSRRHCPFFYTSIVCTAFVVFGECRKSRCIKRHPKTCDAFFESQCRWCKKCAYLHRESMVKIIVEYEKKAEKVVNELFHDDEETIDTDTNKIDKNLQCRIMETVEFDKEDGTDHKHPEESLEEFIAKAKAFDLSTESLDDDDESIETIMAKARAFAEEDDNENILH